LCLQNSWKLWKETTFYIWSFGFAACSWEK
jgi:hypothetical protein